jgi:glycosyltransferase involved in cell wall biosynthesis
MKTRPRVSVGLPVYNGDNYLEQTLKSLTGQSFEDFELIISDNASTDRTEEICRDYAAIDNRIHYHRNAENLGACPNYNRIIPLARGDYFRWHAHDDLLEQQFLEYCVATLDQDSTAVLCHTKQHIIDEKGNTIRINDDRMHLPYEHAHKRLRQYLFRGVGVWAAIFGLIRLDILRRTPLLGSYLGADRVLLGELTLWGKVLRIDEPLFLLRFHDRQSWRAHYSLRQRATWFSRENQHKRFITPRYLAHLFAYLEAIWRVPLGPKERLLCSGYAMRHSLKAFLSQMGGKPTKSKDKSGPPPLPNTQQ